MPNSKKKSIILIHGFRGSHHGLSDIKKYLEKNYIIYDPDIPGSGLAEELSDKSLDGYADWLHKYIRDHKLKKPYIVGHSMGSIIVSYYVNKYPEDVSLKIILLSPIFRTKVGQVCSDISYFMIRNAIGLVPKKNRKKILASKQVSYIISHFFTYDKKQQARIDSLHYKYSGQFSSAKSFMADMKISMRHQTVVPQYGKTLLCIGDHDQLTSCKLVKKRAGKTGAKCEVINNVGHLINYETPKEVARAIKAFIDS